jgi:PAS domain S-box-containing protein
MTTTTVRILLAEDSASDAEVLQENLLQIGGGRFDITWVELLGDALTRLRQQAFDVLLLDLSLPDSAGPDTIRRACYAAPQLPIVVLTGVTDERVGLEAVREGVQDYLVKGQVDGPQIARVIRYAIERKRMEESLRESEERLRLLNAELEQRVAAQTAEIRRANETLERRIAERTSELQAANVVLVESRAAAINLMDDALAARRRAEEAGAGLRASEERYRLAIKATNDAIWDLDLTAAVVHWNDTYALAFGRPPETATSWQWWIDHIHPEDRERTADGLRAAIEGDQNSWTCEYRFRRTDGIWAHILDRAYIARHDSGKACRVVGAMLDLTERKLAEERLRLSLREKEVLLKEIHHRVKNNLQIISSLVSLQAETLNDPALSGLFQDVRDRVRSMALVHERLYQSESLAQVDFAEYTRNLLHYLWRAHGSAVQNFRLQLELQPVTLSMDTAVPCGLLLNELATNALKHAFRGHPEGEVTVTLHTSPDGSICLGVRDNGVGLPAGLDWRQSPSLGLRLVQMLAGQLNATINVMSGVGTEFLVTVPRLDTLAEKRIQT